MAEVHPLLEMDTDLVALELRLEVRTSEEVAASLEDLDLVGNLPPLEPDVELHSSTRH